MLSQVCKTKYSRPKLKEPPVEPANGFCQTWQITRIQNFMVFTVYGYCYLHAGNMEFVKMFLFTNFLWFSITLLVLSVLRRVLWKKSIIRRYPPSLPSLPFVGSLPFIWKFDNMHEFFMSKAKELGPIYTFREGRR